MILRSLNRAVQAGCESAMGSSVMSSSAGCRLAFRIALTVTGSSSSRVQSSLIGSGVRGSSVASKSRWRFFDGATAHQSEGKMFFGDVAAWRKWSKCPRRLCTQ